MPSAATILTLAFPLLSQRVAGRHPRRGASPSHRHARARIWARHRSRDRGDRNERNGALRRENRHHATDHGPGRRLRRARMIHSCDRRTDEMSWRTIAASLMIVSVSAEVPGVMPAHAGDVRAGVSIGVPVPPPPPVMIAAPPRVVVVPGSPVYYSPGVDFNLFVYHQHYYRFHEGARDGPHDRQAQAGAASISMCLPVGVEDVRQGISGDAYARVLDLELELRARIDDPNDDTPATRGKADRVGAEIDHELVKPFLVAEVREVRPVALALQGDTGLLGLRVKLLDGAVHEPREVERLPLELHEPRAQARHLEDLIGEPEQPLGALRDDVGQARLLLREGAWSALVKEVDGTTDRGERRPEFVGDGGEELPLRLLHLAQRSEERRVGKESRDRSRRGAR